jgi:hypothetical protein
LEIDIIDFFGSKKKEITSMANEAGTLIHQGGLYHEFDRMTMSWSADVAF